MDIIGQGKCKLFILMTGNLLRNSCNLVPYSGEETADYLPQNHTSFFIWMLGSGQRLSCYNPFNQVPMEETAGL